jgi:hypothetical protein
MRACHVLVICSFTVTGCHPTTGGGGTPTTSCRLAPVQNGNGLGMSCSINGPIRNLRVDPLTSGNAACGITSFSVFQQTVSTPIVAVYGQNGDDNSERVRVGVTLGPGTHAGKLAKDNALDNCATTIDPTLAISTSFAGTHVALVDKTRSPVCVFQSRLTLTSFQQTIAVGVPADISGMTRKATQESLEKRIDLEVARAVNGLLRSSGPPLSDADVERSGRCDGDYRAFTGS